MKLLIIGDALSQYTIHFSIALKRLDPSVTIDIINTRDFAIGKINPVLNATYNQVFHYRPISGIVEKIPKIRVLFRNYRGAKTLEHVKKNKEIYAVVLIHGFWKLNCEIYYKLNFLNTFTVGAVWGSDFYQRGSNESLVFKTMDSCNLVIISTKNMVDDINKVKLIDNAKIRNCLFGLAPLDLLVKMQHIGLAESKIKLGFDPDDIIITCGYNGSPNQQHLYIISTLTRIVPNIARKLKLLIPMTYGGTREYHENIKKSLIESGLDYTIYDSFLSDETIAYLRKATDIMLQIQRSDAFSGSMLEHLFSQNIIITGSWLPYQSLADNNIYYETIDDLSELDDKLISVLKNIESLSYTAKQLNTPDKFLPSLWSECIKDWHAALKEYELTSE